MPMVFLGATPTIQLTMQFDALRPDAVNRARSTTRTASGKSVNAARVAHTLAPDLPVLATGFLGGDTGRFMREDLERAGIDHRFLDVPPPTRTCVTVIDRASGQVTELVEESAAVPAEAYDRLLALLDELLASRRVLVLSGSLPPGAPADFYARCCRAAQRHAVRAIVDARDVPLARALDEGPDVVKLNAAELASTIGRPLESEEAILAAARELLGRGARRVVVTRGREPVIACDDRSAWRLDLPAVRAVSPIGSGDAFAAGLAVALKRDEPFDRACILGAACGIANALHPVSGHIDPADVHRLITEIRAERV